ncbi:MAG: recombinase RecA [Armatimonadota bacterium]|nr:recombinase RecA [Armatimonadota bacterium]
MNERQRALELALTQIEKQFGKGSIMKLGEATARLQVEVIPTGALALDVALGVGGVPRGRVVEIYGPESSGKTTLGYHIIAEAQREGGVAAFIDAEHALDPNYARAVGVDVDSLLLSQPDSGEQALEIAEMLVRSGAVDVIVIDSVAALVPRAELEGEMGDAHVGLQARLMSQALRKLVGAIAKSRTTVIFINQIREKVGVLFGSPETTTGGRALKFYSSVRMEIRRTENIKSGEEVKGMRARVKVVKNKVAPPFRDAEVDIFYGQGISRAGSVLDVAQAVGVVTRTGTWFAYGDLRLGQGRDNARDFLENNPELMREIEQRVREKLGLTRRPAAGGPGEVAATGAPPVPAVSPAPVAIPSRARGAEPVAPAKEAAAKARG